MADNSPFPQPVPFPPGPRGSCPVPVDLPAELITGFDADEWDRDDQDVGEQPACALCLGPAGSCPLRVWRTRESEDCLSENEVLDEWAVCWSCVQKSGKPLPQLMAELAAGGPRHGG